MKYLQIAASRCFELLCDYLVRCECHAGSRDGLVAASAFGKSFDLRDRSVCHDLLDIGPGDSVLDVGGGHNPLKRADVVVDIDVGMTSHRNNNPLKLFPHQKFVQAAVEDLSCFSDDEFDYVFCSQVLEHVDDPAKACSELQRVAKRGFVDTPRSSTDLVFSHTDHKWFIDYIDHILYFRPKPLACINSPLFKNYGLAAWRSDREVQERVDFLFRCVSNNHFEWEGGFQFKVLDGW